MLKKIPPSPNYSLTTISFKQKKKKQATDTISTAKNPKKSFAYSFCMIDNSFVKVLS